MLWSFFHGWRRACAGRIGKNCVTSELGPPRHDDVKRIVAATGTLGQVNDTSVAFAPGALSFMETCTSFQMVHSASVPEDD